MKFNWNNKLKWALISLGLALVMTALFYLYLNLRYTYGVGDEDYLRIAKYNDVYVHHDEIDEEVAVNVAYDKVHVPYVQKTDYDGFEIADTIGVIDIVDRAKLASFMKMLKEADTYRYIVCDIRLTTEYKTDADEELVELISSMRDIVIADTDSLPQQLKPKAASVRYGKRRVGDDFMKYTCLDEGQETMAFRMWKDLTGGTYESKTLGIKMNGKNCLNYFVPYFRYSIYDNYKDKGEDDLGNEVTVYHLGYDVLAGEPSESVKLFEDKIVLIGAWSKEDSHDTIIGPQPGISVIYNAYHALLNGDNYICWGIYALLFLLFWIMCMILFRSCYTEKQLLSKINKNWVRVSVRILVAIFSYNLILFIVAGFFFFAFNMYVNVFVVGFLFSGLDTILGEVRSN